MKLRSLLLMQALIASFSAAILAQPSHQDIQSFHQAILTIDSHTDTPLLLGRKGYDIGKRNDPYQRGGKIDFIRMQEGGLDAVFFAVFVGQGPRNDSANERAYQRAIGLFEQIEQALDSYPELAGLATNPQEIIDLEKNGRSAVLIGVENGYPIGDKLERIQEFYNRGARYITLSHTKNNDLCDASTDQEEHGGLSDFGKEVVKEMNRVGMMIDVSHISDKAFFDVLEITDYPVIASHSNVRALCNNPRNMTDEMLFALRDNGGVIQVCVLSDYVKELPENPEREAAFSKLREKYNQFQGLTDEEMNRAREEWYATDQKFPKALANVADLVDHIDYIVKLIGIDYVGIGTDFDGGGALSDCYDVSEIVNITAELVRRGYDEKQIEKIWGGNFLRVFSVVADKTSK